MKIILIGYGKMGKLVEQIALQSGHTVTAKISRYTPVKHQDVGKGDVCIDFSEPQAVLSHIKWACESHLPIVIGTTGWESHLEKAKSYVEKSAGTALFAPNFSLSVYFFLKLLKEAKKMFSSLSEYAVEGVEWHHNQKKDMPSGTAKLIADELNLSPFTSVRLGSMPGKHEVIFDSPSDTLSFTHTARNRLPYAKGALKAAEWIIEQAGWLTLDEMFRSLYSTDYSL